MPHPLFAIIAIAVAAGLGGCSALHEGRPDAWFAARGGVPPHGTNRIVVCHGFGCHLKTAVGLSGVDLATMRRKIGPARTAREERAGIARMIAWAEVRVAREVGSANDVGGLDLANAGVAGQMDCIDEAANTTSYLLVAQKAGLLRHHGVGRPVARGYFLDGRYPHATAVIVADGTPWAVDSWPNANGAKPDIMPLATWYATSPAHWFGLTW